MTTNVEYVAPLEEFNVETKMIAKVTELEH